MPTLHALVEQWGKRSPREQLLSLAVAAMTMGLLVLLSIQGAQATLAHLDRDIERMTTDLVNYHYQIARRESVDARFARVSSQHSSAWSESEIRDRLRQEIYRLANRVPPGLDEDGIPLSTNSAEGVLVSIPKLGQGRLKEGGEGYREYQITVSIPAVPVRDMLAYLERLQGSPQSLRLDRIDLRRHPSRSEVGADVDITRIVVDTPAIEDAPQPTTTPAVKAIALNPADWTFEGCDGVLEENNTLFIQGEKTAARFWMARSLPAGTTYDVQLEAEASGPVQIAVAVDGVDMAGQAPVTLAANTGPYAIHLRFTVPSDSGGRASIQFPSIRMEAPDTTVRLYRLQVQAVSRL